MRKDVGLHVASHLLEIRGRIVGKTNEQQTGDVADMNHPETELATVEVIAHVFGMDEVSTQIVCPLMVWANDIPDAALVTVAKARSTMTANVVKSTNRHVVVASDNDRRPPQRYREIIAGLGNVRLDADKYPVLPKNDVHIEIEDVFASIKGRLEAVSRPPARDHGPQFVG
jgi:hypothetical protein